MATMAQAIRMALAYGEQHLGVTDIFGEDVGPPLGGVFTCTQGLQTAWNSPLDERGIVGAAIGLAIAGQRPVAEIQFCDYIFNTIDLLKLATNSTWSSGGEFNFPMVIKTTTGSGVHGSIYHSHSFDAIATHIPGWKIVYPSNAVDAYGLMIAALKDSNPVLYLEPKAMLRNKCAERIPGEPEDERALRDMIDAPLGDRKNWKPKWPEGLTDFTVPIGKAKLCRTGADATVVSYGRTLPLCLDAADALVKEGIHYDVLDLRTLMPYDWDAIAQSIKKTGRVLFVNEDTEITNFGEHLLRRTVDEFFYELRVRPRVLAGKHVPGVGMAPTLEDASVPQLPDVLREMRELATEPE
ncbi:MAG: alpha-ketoacid dehydrogenase subunit beta [Planctomycetes bacterium]|nr:alpha-ketoacid dehydrogenase subunit beta [Planctomycetota bacterium]